MFGMAFLLAPCCLLYGVLAQAVPTQEEHVAQNVQVGEPDYPSGNPNPTRVIRLNGYLSSPLEIQIIANYSASPNANSQKGQDASCGYALSSITFEPFHVDAPLTLLRLKDSSYVAEVAVDKYLPGRCGWHLRSLEFIVLNGIGVFREGVFATVFDPSRSKDSPDKLYQGDINLWCKKDPYPPDPAHPMNCSTLSMLAEAFFVSPEQIAAIPRSQRNDQLHTWIFPDTKALKVNFYDLDSLTETGKHGH
jgi:hypothetical protein